jgi:NitT/TauT family transport system permease protein
MKTKYYTFIGPIALLLIWELVSLFKIVDPFFLPAPHNVLIELFKLLGTQQILYDIFSTLWRFLIALGISIIIGIPLGILIGSNMKLHKSTDTLIDFLRSIPVTAMFPLFLLIFGLGDTSKVGVTIFVCALLLIFITSNAIISTKKTRTLATKLMGANKYQIFKHVIFWECLPQIITGIRTAISWGLIVIIVTEMFIGTNLGIGRRIMDFQQIYNIQGLYAMIIIAGLIGFAINFGFAQLEKRLIHWSGKS